MSGKRKADADLSRPTRSKQPPRLDTIETLEPLDCAFPTNQLTVDNVKAVFPSISVAQQQVDLWTIFISPHFKHGTNLAPLFSSWLYVNHFSLDQVVQWRQGPVSNSLQQWKPTGAKIATRAVKTLRKLSEELSIAAKVEVEKKCLRMESSYIMFMYATQLNNIDNMIPNHANRVARIFQRLSDDLPPMQSVKEDRQEPAIVVDADQEEKSSEIMDIVKGFCQPVDTKLPPVIGHDGKTTGWKLRHCNDTAIDLRKRLDRQIEIPMLLPHLLDPQEKVGFRSILLFGPPGNGKTLFAQSLAAQRGMTLFKVSMDTLTQKYVGETEK